VAAHDPVGLADMVMNVSAESGLDATIDRLVEYVRPATGCDAAGIMLSTKKSITPAVATSQEARQADALQVDLGQGPCVRAVWDADAVLVTDTASDPRWPDWSAKVAGLGYASVLSLRLFDRQSTLGALNLYSHVQSAFDEDDIEVAEIFARHASVALSSAKEEEGLRTAIGAQKRIGQAQGILMERFGLDEDQAFAVLRRYSQDNNTKLRDVAEHIIATRRLPHEA
jgi:GAF domain-containing protein